MNFGYFIKTERIFVYFLIFLATLANHKTEANKRQKCKSDSFQCGSGDCIDPLLKCDGILHCKDGSDETSATCSNTFCPPYMFQCDYGGCVKISSICNGINDCIDNSDEPPINQCIFPVPPKGVPGTTIKPPKPKPTTSTPTTSRPVPTRAPIPSTTESLPRNPGACQLPAKTEDQEYVINDCDVQPGNAFCNYQPGQYIDSFTTITLRCNPNYYSPVSQNTVSFCLEETWTPSIVRCEECGLTTAPGNVNDNYVPWLVAIYDAQQSYNICWGTLLSPYIVLTAAHCFLDATSNAKKQPSDFFAMLGKRLTSGQEDNETKQCRIASINFVNDAFGGAKSNYEGNLALLEMDYNITYSEYIKPVCVDWQNRINFSPNDGAQGLIPAWILNRHLARSELRPQKSPYISNASCRTLAADHSKPLITEDKFCATLSPGTTIDDRNGGNGFYLASPNKNNNHLFGVVSTHFYDRTNTPVLIVTDVNKYLTKIASVMEEIENRRKSEGLIDVRFPSEKFASKKSN